MTTDKVSLYIDPLLSKDEVLYLKYKSSTYGKRTDLHKFINNMIIFITNMKSSTRYNFLEFFILLKLNDKPFLTKHQRTRINEYSKNYNYHINSSNATKKGYLKLAIDQGCDLALKSSNTVRVLDKISAIKNTLPVLIENVPVVTKDEITLEDVLTKRLQLLRSAKSRNLEFNLTDEDVRQILERKTCYYTKARFSSSPDYQRTVDRIDNKLGYISGNVVACIHGVNQLKNLLIENNNNGKFILTIKQLKTMVSKL